MTVSPAPSRTETFAGLEGSTVDVLLPTEETQVGFGSALANAGTSSSKLHVWPEARSKLVEADEFPLGASVKRLSAVNDALLSNWKTVVGALFGVSTFLMTILPAVSGRGLT